MAAYGTIIPVCPANIADNLFSRVYQRVPRYGPIEGSKIRATYAKYIGFLCYYWYHLNTCNPSPSFCCAASLILCLVPPSSLIATSQLRRRVSCYASLLSDFLLILCLISSFSVNAPFQLRRRVSCYASVLSDFSAHSLPCLALLSQLHSGGVHPACIY